MKNIKKIDNKGFVIVETIIVTVFIIGICGVIFQNLLPLIGEYEKVSYYDDLDSKYKTHEIRKMILREIKKDPTKKSLFINNISDDVFYKQYKSETSNDAFTNPICNELTDEKYCNVLLSDKFLDVNQIIITSFKLSELKLAAKNDENISRLVNDYLDYLPSYSKYSSEYDNYYRIIVVFNNGYIANIEVNCDEI